MAYSEYWITDNVYQRVDFRIFKNMIVPDTPIDERVHTRKEVSAILKELHRKQAVNLFFASTFWTKLQNIFGHYCKSKLDKVAKPRLAAILPAA